jgi:hypothetical protein
MREIKFRGLSINGHWYYGLLSNPKVNMPGGAKKDHWYISNAAGSPFAYEVRPETIGQFTGLKDKKGNEIYEGDILSCMQRMHEVSINFNGYYLQRYKLWRGKFVPSFQYCMSLITKPSKNRFGGEVDRAEVIGNKFQNPELIQSLQSAS